MKQDNIKRVIAAARDLIKKRYQKEPHNTIVAAALMTQSGHIYTGLNVGTNQPSIATCAEIIAIGGALMAEEDMKIDIIVAVKDQAGHIVSPCGKCREYIYDYGSPETGVVIPMDHEKGYVVVPIKDLLPSKYEKPCAC